MSKKQRNALIIVFIILVIGLIGIIVLLNQNEENWITDSNELYEKAVKYIEEEQKKAYGSKEQDYQIFTDYEGFGIEQKDNKKYAYMWILEEAYYTKNNKLMSDHGGSVAYKFTFENDEVIKYEVPLDGSYYTSSIKEMFPESIQDKILNYQMDSSKLRECVKEHYSYLPSTEIVHVDFDETVMIFTGYYGGHTTKANANTIKGKCIDRYGNVYDYEIPCDENEEMQVGIDEINTDMVEKYKGDKAIQLSEQDLEIILNNMNNISNEYKNVSIVAEDAPSYFAYIIVGENKWKLMSDSKENISEAGTQIIDVIRKNNIINM